jgi:uroporphyrinogen III methyltransferase/synthase
MAAGRAAETPAAIIQWAATTRQRTILATLATLADRAAQAGLAAPAVVVVGQVAALRQELAWFERLPLFGLTIVVTRARRQASDLACRLRELGARALELPTIAIEPASGDGLAAALARLGEFHWLVFTSSNAVDIFFAALGEQGGDARRLAGLKVAAMGPGTAEALASHGVQADLVPPEAIAESLADALLAAGVGPRARVLLPRAEGAREVLPEALRRAGAAVEDIAIYRTVVPREVDEQILAEVVDGRADLVAFTSSSTARHFAQLVEAQAPMLEPASPAAAGRPAGGLHRGQAGAAALARLKRTLKCAAIGPITAGTARELGFEVAVESPEHTIAGLVEAICRWAALLRAKERST